LNAKIGVVIKITTVDTTPVLGEDVMHFFIVASDGPIITGEATKGLKGGILEPPIGISFAASNRVTDTLPPTLKLKALIASAFGMDKLVNTADIVADSVRVQAVGLERNLREKLGPQLGGVSGSGSVLVTPVKGDGSMKGLGPYAKLGLGKEFMTEPQKFGEPGELKGLGLTIISVLGRGDLLFLELGGPPSRVKGFVNFGKGAEIINSSIARKKPSSLNIMSEDSLVEGINIISPNGSTLAVSLIPILLFGGGARDRRGAIPDFMGVWVVGQANADFQTGMAGEGKVVSDMDVGGEIPGGVIADDVINPAPGMTNSGGIPFATDGIGGRGGYAFGSEEDLNEIMIFSSEESSLSGGVAAGFLLEVPHN
jgi:hypothetical protein